MLGVETKEFENLYNVELLDDMYCCCNNQNICVNDIAALKAMASCTLPCDTYFVVRVQDCRFNVQCTINETFNIEPETQFRLSSVIFQIPFVQPSLDMQVRTIIVHFNQVRLYV